MERRFYTDPLGAAWMAKHFGMRFTDKAGISVSVDPGMWYMAERHYHAGSLFIHPDSLYVLEPRVGDVIRKAEDVYIISPDHHEYRARSQFVTIAESEGSMIIQRNGIPFMWPESEVA